jgi:hypothetical protein
MPKATSTNYEKKRKAKNNLDNFDISQIEADLVAIESEALNLDQQSQRNLSRRQNNPELGTSEEQKFKSRDVNVVDFNPDNSLLLHRILRSDSPKARPASPPTNAKNKVHNLNLKVKRTAPITKKTEKPSMDGLSLAKKTKKIASPSKKRNSKAAVKPLNTTAVALNGLRKANQFNQFALRTHGTNLQRQIEKSALFKVGPNDSVEVFKDKLETKANQKVYNLTRRKAMLGGVDHHNLGPGRARKLISLRPVKFIAPVIGIFIIGAYFMYLNTPTINIKMAESRSGISISQPGYTPKGFKLSNQLEASTGEVAMSFENGASSYQVAQKVSDWDSKALLENMVLKETNEYSAYADRGLTIYVFNDKAVWVNQGKINEIKFKNVQLDVEEMIRIAGSM